MCLSMSSISPLLVPESSTVTNSSAYNPNPSSPPPLGGATDVVKQLSSATSCGCNHAPQQQLHDAATVALPL